MMRPTRLMSILGYLNAMSEINLKSSMLLRFLYDCDKPAYYMFLVWYIIINDIPITKRRTYLFTDTFWQRYIGTNDSQTKSPM